MLVLWFVTIILATFIVTRLTPAADVTRSRDLSGSESLRTSTPSRQEDPTRLAPSLPVSCLLT
jgi:hypothetical protein